MANVAKRNIYPFHMKTFLVTGANSGLGFELTRALAGRGERVLMASRDVRRGEEAKAKVLLEHPHGVHQHGVGLSGARSEGTRGEGGLEPSDRRAEHA